MIRRTIREMTGMIHVENGEELQHNETLVHGVCIDSRKIEKGNLYVPLTGRHADGHQYVEDAFRRGAAASLWQKDVPNPPANVPLLIVEDTEKSLQELSKSYRNALRAKVVGITGSNGKTTTKDMVASVLSEKFKVQKTEGNFNNHQGVPLTLLSLDEDTEIAVVEMGMSAKGEISFLTSIARPDVAIITNIGEAHIQNLGSREAIADAKLEITEGLPENGLLIYMGDEPLLQERVPNITGIRTKTFGKGHGNDLYPVEWKQETSSSTFRTNASGDIDFYLPVLGEYNVINSLAAILAGREFGMPFEEIRAGLGKTRLSAMRMEMADGINGSKIINDAYNASPTSMRAAIRLVEQFEGTGRKILVLGDMLELGEKEAAFHREVGRDLNPEKIDFVFTYGKLGRLIAEACDFPDNRVFAFEDKERLIDMLKGKIGAGDLVLVKASRGMQLEEVVKAITVS
ncbi:MULTISPECIES: UDP-N-acetylmuramoyl-tripeptide--D-alanyl-D-alanine ligase [Heyndrickxia]|uniref:UDP-N-acetylmuramoyl-tripeptide--D-alanyl-D- alanine ligase n=1 Tax=Heyndrickxia TaxID=2837504 RepID=UPI002DB7B2E0|nr:UDP-N-acetylmuramoyl-tripeptide--D-alanyl-D-alanine ligase [Weizmannia sp. CD-2023]MEC2304288.1 UDP-N-acetylmuramoyl-tripeptide--D-alanyl-D-alanine ligase [Weizmannia sp. CD-2023]MEC2341148.1 UDP-N-acetylmuramoyl-tripeptide--D-alanyl-D-alanine ligase [Weizmannia sp. CD-2023]